MKNKRLIAGMLTFLLMFNISNTLVVNASVNSNDESKLMYAKDNEKKESEIGRKISIRDILEINDEVLVSWDSIKEATGYQVKINNEIINVDKNYIRYKQSTGENYVYSVRYKMGEEYSIWSEQKQFLIKPQEGVVKNYSRQAASVNTGLVISGSVFGDKNGVTGWHNLADDGDGFKAILLDNPIQMIKLEADKSSGVNIKYRVYIKEDKGWTDWVEQGKEAGVKNKSISSIQVQYSGEKKVLVQYSTINTDGELSPIYNNGESNGNEEKLESIKGIKINIDENYTVLNEDEVWKANSEKNIKGIVEIPEGKTLTIENGVKVNFSNDEGKQTGFIVKGNLDIRGSGGDYTNILSPNNNFNINIKYTGKASIYCANITSKEQSDSSFINAFGKIEISRCNLINTGEKIRVNGILMNQDRFNNSKNRNLISFLEISNVDKGISVYSTQDAISIIGNKIKNSNVGINIKNNSYTANDNNIEIDTNTLENNLCGINIEQNSMEKKKSYKSILINRNNINNSILKGISLKVDGVSNLNIKDNTITGTNIKKAVKDANGKYLVGGPIVLEEALLFEDTEDLLRNINNTKEPNILTGNNYDTIILDKIAIGDNTKVSIKSGKYIPLISDSLESYNESVVNISAGTNVKVRGGTKSEINIRGIINFDGTADNPVKLSNLSAGGVSYIDNSDDGDLKSTNIKIKENGSIICNGLQISDFNIDKGSILETEVNTYCIIKNISLLNCKSSSTGGYGIALKGDNAVLSNVNINNEGTKDSFNSYGIGLLGNSAVVDNININYVSGIGLNINGDEGVLKNINISNVRGTKGTGIRASSKLKGTLIQGGNISGVVYGCSLYGGKSLIYSAIIQGVTIIASNYGVDINPDVSGLENCIIEISGCEITSNIGIYGGQDANKIVLNLQSNKIITVKSNLIEESTYCVYMTDNCEGTLNVISNSFIQGIPGTWCHISLINPDWETNIDGNAFGDKVGNNINWDALTFIIKNDEIYSDFPNENRKKYDVSKFGISNNVDISGTITDIINDNQYMIRKLFGKEGVMSSTGNYSFTREDLTLESAGIDFLFKRTYNSLDNNGGMLGKGWTINYESKISKKQKDVKTFVEVTLPDSGVESYLLEGNSYVALDTRSTLTYDSQTQEYLLKDNKGFKYTFRSDGKLKNQIDKYGNIIELSYKEDGRLDKIVDKVGRQYVFDYSVDKKITVIEKIDGKDNRRFTYNLNSNNQLESVTSVYGSKIESFKYDNNKIIQIDKPSKSEIETVKYNDDNTIKEHKNNLGNVLTYDYDKENKKTTITDKNGLVKTENYDANSLIYYISYSDGTYESNTYNYSLIQKVNGEDKKMVLLELLEDRDREGKVTKYKYDNYGNVVELENNDGTTNKFIYDGSGNILEEENEEGIKKNYTYYDDNTLKSESINIEAEGIKDSSGNTIKNSEVKYEGNDNSIIKGLIKKKINPNGSYVEYEYDKYGYLYREIDEGKINNKDKNVKRTVYNGQGLKVEEYIEGATDDLGIVKTKYMYLPDGKMVVKDINNKASYQYPYDPIGNVLREINPDNSMKITYYYQGTDLIANVTERNGSGTTYYYDDYGRLIKKVNPNGSREEYKYDALNRVTEKYFSFDINENAKLIETNTYVNNNGNINILTTKYINKEEFINEVTEKDWRGNVTRTVDGNGNEKRYTYTKDGKIQSEVKPDKSIKKYIYNGRGLIQSEYEQKFDKDKNSYYEVKTYKYDLQGRIVTEGLGADFVKINEQPSKLIEKNTIYFDNGKIKEENQSVNGVYTGAKIKYDYDKEGNKKLEETQVDNERAIKKEWKYNYAIKDELYNVTQTTPIEKRDLGINEEDESGVTEIKNIKIYDGSNNIISDETYKKVEGNESKLSRKKTYKYDAMSNIIEESLYENDSSTPKSKIVREFNASNVISKETDENGVSTKYGYDTRLNLTSKTKRGDMELYSYDFLNRVIWEASGLDCRVTEQKLVELYGSDSKSEEYRLLYDFTKDGKIDIYDIVSLNSGATVINKTNYYYDKANNIVAKEKEFGNDSGEIVKELISGYQYNGQNKVIKECNGEALKNINLNTLKEEISNAYGTIYGYDSQGELVSIKRPEDKKVITFEYLNTEIAQNNDVNVGRIKSEIKEKGTYKTTFNISGKEILKESIENNKTIAIEKKSYDNLNNMICLEDGNGNKTYYEYNNLGKIRKEVLPGDETIEENVITHRYNPYGEEVFTKDSVGKINTKERDFKGRVITDKTKSLSNITTNNKVDITKSYKYAIEDGNTIVTETDGNKNEIIKTYDYVDRLIEENRSITDVYGNKSQAIKKYNYLSEDLILSEVDIYGNTIKNKYDAYGRLIQRLNGKGEVVEKLEYYKNGAQKYSIDALNNTKVFKYDKNKRLIEIVDGEGNSNKKEYDSNDNVSAIIDGKNNRIEYKYDLRNRLLLVESKSTVKLANQYQYDNNNNLLSVVDGENRKKEYSYNSRNLVYSVEENTNDTIDGNNYTEKYSYYPNGQLKENIDKNGNKIEKSIDVLGREIESKTPKNTINTTYDNNNNKTIVSIKENGKVLSSNNSEFITRSYDELNRVKSKHSLGKEVKYTYDGTLDVESGYHYETVVDFNNNVTKRIYDKAGRLVNSIENGDNTTITYYPNGSRQSIEYSSGVKEEYSYNKNNLLTSLTNKNGENILSTYKYTYDENNRMISKEDNKGKTSYSYDALNRISGVNEQDKKRTQYQYDSSGNRVNETIDENGIKTILTYNYDASNRLEGITSKQGNTILNTRTYKYDNNGNIKNEVVENKTGDAKKTELSYVYDDNNNLLETKDSSGKIIEANRYNGEGQRIERKTNSENTKFVYEGANPILELDGSTLSIKAKNEFLGDTILSRNIGQNKYNYLYNGHGDVVNLLDKQGNIKNSYYYDSFGVIQESNETVNNPYKYSKYYYDKESSKYYLNSRMYDPVSGRFMQQDSYLGEINDPLSLNLYTYTVNDPLTYYDPSGNIPVVLLGALVAAGFNLLGDYLDDGKINRGARSYLGAGVDGAIGVTFGGLAKGLSWGSRIGINFLGGFVGDSANQAISTGEINFKNAGINAVFGLVIDGAITGAGSLLRGAGKEVAPVLKPAVSRLKEYGDLAYTGLKGVGSRIKSIGSNIVPSSSNLRNTVSVNYKAFKGAVQESFYPSGSVILGSNGGQISKFGESFNAIRKSLDVEGVADAPLALPESSRWAAAEEKLARAAAGQGTGPVIELPGSIDLNIKPSASNTRLQNIIDNLYKGQSNPLRTGNGTTMDAIRNELVTGQPTLGLSHFTKGKESINGLNKLLKRGALSPQDEVITKNLLEDLKNALSGKQ